MSSRWQQNMLTFSLIWIFSHYYLLFPWITYGFLTFYSEFNIKLLNYQDNKPVVFFPLQVRPKTQIPDSLPHSPCQELQPLSLQRVTAVVSPKSQAPTLPTANSTFSSDHRQVSQSNASPSAGPDLGAAAQHVSAGPGVAYAIIAASPATGNGVSAVSEAVKVRTRFTKSSEALKSDD